MDRITLNQNPPDDLPAHGQVDLFYNRVTGQIEAEDWQGNPISVGEGQVPVFDSLDSDSSTAALSAKQGQNLKTLIGDTVIPVAGAGASVLDRYLDSVKEAAGNTTAALSCYIPIANDSGAPINVYTDAGATTPATVGSNVLTIKDPVSGLVWTRFSGTSTLGLNGQGLPVLNCVAAAFGATTDLTNVTAFWAVSKKSNVLASNGLLGFNVGPNFFGLWDTDSASGFGLGFAIAGGSTNGAETERDTIANNESRALTSLRLHTGFIANDHIHYSINGRVWKSNGNSGVTSGSINVIGYNAANSAFFFTGELAAIATATGKLSLNFIDTINARLGKTFKLPITSSYRRLLVEIGTSMEAPDGTAGPNNSVADFVQRELGDGWRVENTAVGGAQTPELMAWNRERFYDNTKPKMCFIAGIYNQMAGLGADRTADASLASMRAYYLQLKALGFQVFTRTVPYRADLTGITGAVTIAEFYTRVDYVNAKLLDSNALGFYHDGIIDMTEDALIMDPYNATYRPDLVHGSALWTERVAEVYVVPFLRRLLLDQV